MLTHPNAEIQAVYEMLENQRDNAIVLAAGARGQVIEMQGQLAERDKQIATLTEQLLAAAKFQNGDGAVVVPLPVGGNAA